MVMNVNIDKTKVIHFRPSSCKPTSYNFTLGREKVETVDRYKYLGVVLNEHLNFNVTADILADSSGRALGAVIGKSKHLKDLSYACLHKII